MKRQKRNHQKKISSQYQILLEPDWNQAENCLRFENCSRIRKVEQTHTVQINANPHQVPCTNPNNHTENILSSFCPSPLIASARCS